MGDLPYLLDIKLDIDNEDDMSLNETLHTMNNTIDSMYARWSLLRSYPERERCGKYMKTGVCLAGATCKYDHPIRENITEEIVADNMLYLTYTTERLIRILKTFSYEAAVDVLGTMCGVVVVLEKEYDMALTHHSYGQSCYLYGDLVMRLSIEIENFCSTKLSQPRKTPTHQQRHPRNVDENIPVFVNCSVRLKAVYQRWLDMEDTIRTDTVSLLLLECTSVNDDYDPAVCVEEVTQLLSENIMSHTRNAVLSQQDVQSIHTSIRLDLLDVFHKAWPNVSGLDIAVFGSTAVMLGDGGSDLDLTLILPASTNASEDLERAATAAESAGFAVTEVVKDTRISVLKLRHLSSNTDVDVVINDKLALQNTALVRNYILVDDRIRPLVLAVKHWARRRGCRDPRNATLSSYAWTLMVIYFLRMRPANTLPAIHDLPDMVLVAKTRESKRQFRRSELTSVAINADAAGEGAVTEEVGSNIGKLLVEFFAFYGTCSPSGFQPFQAVLSLRNACRVYKTTSHLYVPRYDLKSATEAISMAFLDNRACRHHQDLSRSSGHVSKPPSGVGSNPLLSGTTSTESIDTVVYSSPPTWRFCIEDPFEENDLGRVIYCMTGQIHIMNELKRAVTLFNDMIVKYRLVRGIGSVEERDDEKLRDYWRQLCAENTDVPIAQKTCTVCGRSGHFSKDCETTKCNLCNQKGHFMRDCIMLFCSNCSQQGHFAKDCKKEKICRFCKQSGHQLKFCPLRACTKCGSRKHKASRCPVPAEAKGSANMSLVDFSGHKSVVVEGSGGGMPANRSALVPATGVSDGGSRDRSEREGNWSVTECSGVGNIWYKKTGKHPSAEHHPCNHQQQPELQEARLVSEEKTHTRVTAESIALTQFRKQNRERSDSLSSTGSTTVPGEVQQPFRRRQKSSAAGGQSGGDGGDVGAGTGGQELGGGRLSARLAGVIENKVVVPLVPGDGDLKLIPTAPLGSIGEEKLAVVTEGVDTDQAAPKSPRKTATGAKFATTKSGRVDSALNAVPMLASAKVDSKIVLTPSSGLARSGTHRSFSEKKGPATDMAESIEDEMYGTVNSDDKYISSSRDNTDLYLSDDKLSNSPINVQSPAKMAKKTSGVRKKILKLPMSSGGGARRGNSGCRNRISSPQRPESTDIEYHTAGVKRNESKYTREKKRNCIAALPNTYNSIPMRREEQGEDEHVGGFFCE